MPPSVPDYAGPKLTLYVAAQSLFAVTSSGVFPWTNPERLLGAANDSKASVTLTNSSNFVSDSLLLKFNAPASDQRSRINAFQYSILAISTNESSGDRNGMLLNVTDAAGTSKGASEGVHEYSAAAPGDYGTATYLAAAVPGPEQTSLFTSSGAAANNLGTNAARVQDFGGIIIRAYAPGVANGEVVTTLLDGMQVILFVTPPDLGQRITNLIPSSVAAVSAATAGIDLDANWGAEAVPASVSNALTNNATRSTVAGTDTDQYPQTQFYTYTFAAGLVGNHVGNALKELRATWRGRTESQGTTLNQSDDYAIVGEFYLAKADGTVLIKASADGKALYDSLNTKVGHFGSASASSERDRDLVMDISGLSGADIESMMTAGFKVGFRFNIFNPGNTDPGNESNPMILYLNGATFTISSDPPGGTGGLDTGGRISRGTEGSGRMNRMSR